MAQTGNLATILDFSLLPSLIQTHQQPRSSAVGLGSGTDVPCGAPAQRRGLLPRLCSGCSLRSAACCVGAAAGRPPPDQVSAQHGPRVAGREQQRLGGACEPFCDRARPLHRACCPCHGPAFNLRASACIIPSARTPFSSMAVPPFPQCPAQGTVTEGGLPPASPACPARCSEPRSGSGGRGCSQVPIAPHPH